MERIPTAKFPDPVLWLRLGEQQLHLFESCGRDARRRAHTCPSTSTTSTRVYAKAKEMGILDSSAFGSPLRSHPAGWVQIYLRDPGREPGRDRLAGRRARSTRPREPTSPRWRAPFRRTATRAIATLYHS